jgi:toxin ParE1/3/4
LIVRFSNEAIRDLEEIEVYGVLNFGVTVAQNYLLRLKQTIDHLQHFPELARPHPDLIANARVLPVASHIIVYRNSDINIDILRILHGRQNWKQPT